MVVGGDAQVLERVRPLLDKVIEVVGSGAAANWFLEHRGRSMVERRFAPGFKVPLHHKDLQNQPHPKGGSYAD